MNELNLAIDTAVSPERLATFIDGLAGGVKIVATAVNGVLDMVERASEIIAWMSGGQSKEEQERFIKKTETTNQQLHAQIVAMGKGEVDPGQAAFIRKYRGLTDPDAIRAEAARDIVDQATQEGLIKDGKIDTALVNQQITNRVRGRIGLRQALKFAPQATGLGPADRRAAREFAGFGDIPVPGEPTLGPLMQNIVDTNRRASERMDQASKNINEASRNLNEASRNDRAGAR